MKLKDGLLLITLPSDALESLPHRNSSEANLFSAKLILGKKKKKKKNLKEIL